MASPLDTQLLDAARQAATLVSAGSQRPSVLAEGAEDETKTRELGEALDAVVRASCTDWRLGHEIVLCGRLIKGYGGTHQRGRDNLLHILDQLAERTAFGNASERAQAIAQARGAALADEGGQALDATLKPHDQLSQLNVLVQLEHLMTYPIVRQQVMAGALVLSGWWFDIATGAMYAYERASRSFEIIDRALAERITSRLASRAR